mmetsp:Transcript_28322/g.37809  ORF Transcript_28322/g.37809 Transcript_28322/m.37809 type:complete len:105 (-) Transcript_28322:1827-2141(-)
MAFGLAAATLAAYTLQGKRQLAHAEAEEEKKTEQVAQAEAGEKSEESKPKDAPEEEEEEELIGGVFREITGKNAAALLGDQRTRRMIYLYKDKENLGQVAHFAV